jgi:hypothetical protein
MVSLKIFSGSFDSSICPGVDLASKNEYQDIYGGEGGRCVTFTFIVPKVETIREP